ncbi:MAG TPA: TlpA disulfide reductase family protein [Myxococcota bacterium]|nr:TlpA disulfide reductase family protein [Myxococcota bacterium]
MKGRAGAWLIAAAVAVAALFALYGSSRTAPPVTRGSAAPAFSLPRLAGDGEVSLEALRGKVVLLNFWATWCAPCEDEMPAMQRLHDGLAGQPFELLAVSVDQSADDVKAFRERLDLSFPILLDPDRKASGLYQTFRYPESFLIDQRGVVVERYVGPRAWDDPLYVQRIKELMGQG